MAHYMNENSKLWSYARKLEEKMAEANATMSSLEAEVAHLNRVVSEEKMWAGVEDQKKRINCHTFEGLLQVV